MKKGLSLRLLIYEIRNTTGNVAVLIFGVFFPLLMSILLAHSVSGSLPLAQRTQAETSIFLILIVLIPMATMLIGYSANYAREIDDHIPLRLNLFGIRKPVLLTAKLLSNLIFMIAAIAIYTIIDFHYLTIQTPSFAAICLLALVLIIIGAILLVIAHSIAHICGKFSRSYMTTMLLYFGIMIICGMMGVQTSQLPDFLQHLANYIPMSYMGTDFYKIWTGESYNYAPFVKSFFTFAGFAAVLFVLSVIKGRRRK